MTVTTVMQQGISLAWDEFEAFAIAVGKVDKETAILTIDTETNGKDIRDGRGYLIGISMTVRVDSDYFSIYLPFKHKTEECVSQDIADRVRKIIEYWPGYIVFHNAKFDLESLRTAGINYKGKFYDTMLMCHLINENYPFDKGLSSCVKHYVDKEMSKKDDPAFKWLTEFYGWDGVPINVMREYAEHDAYITARLFYAIIDKFKEEIPDEYWEHRQKFTHVIIAMERRGILIDKGLASVMVAQGEAELERITIALNGFNPGSNKDLHYLFIEKLKMPVIKRSKKTQAPSFDKEAMEEYDRLLETEDDETAKLVFAYRGWQKTVSSNYRAYLELLSPDGRVRPNYKLHGTKTGRMSCSKPNLQQIPRKTEKPWNGNLKDTFIPTPGYELWEFDYAQLELRLATAYAKEEALMEVFLQGRDIFSEMALKLGLPRQQTKTFVYSTQYGAGLDRLMHVFKISREQADDMRRNYYNAYPGFVAVSQRASKLCKYSGKLQLWSGRYRHFFDRREDAHKAFNSVIQGGAADIVESVMVRLFEEIDDEDACRMLLQVHDSVVFEIRSDSVDAYVPKIQALMEDVKPDFGVKFAVESKKWGEK